MSPRRSPRPCTSRARRATRSTSSPATIRSSRPSPPCWEGDIHSGPVLIAYDGSDGAERAVREAGALLGARPALVVVVWKAGLGFQLVELPASTIGLPPATIDIRTALEIDREFSERAQQLAQKGAGLARDAGFEAEGLAVADDPEIPVHETIVRVARERDAQAVVVGTHGHGPVGEVLLGGVSRGVIRRAPSPVIVVR